MGEMTPEQQRITIAEACGWRCAKHVAEFDKIHATMCWVKPNANEWQTQELPDYLNDLNAMHEAENALNDCEVKWGEFRHHLMHIIERTRHELHATARQRAEAFLRTLNLWVE